jgi:hypothetical protein
MADHETIDPKKHNVDELRSIAVDEGVDINDATTKAQMAELINAARASDENAEETQDSVEFPGDEPHETQNEPDPADPENDEVASPAAGGGALDEPGGPADDGNRPETEGRDPEDTASAPTVGIAEQQVVDGREYRELPANEKHDTDRRDEERIDTRLNGDAHRGAEFAPDPTAADFEKRLAAATTTPEAGPLVDTAVDGETNQASRDAEAESKEWGAGSQLGIRESIYDAAPGKTLDDVLQRNAELAEGKHQDDGVERRPVQWYVVQDESTLVEVAQTLGLHDFTELRSVNGRWNGDNNVQRGQKIILPDHYTFEGIDHVVTEGDEEVAEPEPQPVD